MPWAAWTWDNIQVNRLILGFVAIPLSWPIGRAPQGPLTEKPDTGAAASRTGEDDWGRAPAGLPNVILHHWHHDRRGRGIIAGGWWDRGERDSPEGA
jgi:hypothetical protein